MSSKLLDGIFSRHGGLVRSINGHLPVEHTWSGLIEAGMCPLAELELRDLVN